MEKIIRNFSAIVFAESLSAVLIGGVILGACGLVFIFINQLIAVLLYGNFLLWNEYFTLELADNLNGKIKKNNKMLLLQRNCESKET